LALVVVWRSFVRFLQKAVCFCYNINGNHMASSGCSGPIFLVISLEVVGRNTGSTLAALTPVIYDASTRAVVIDSIGSKRCQQPIQVPQHAESLFRRRDVRLDDACGGSKQQLGPHQWPGRCLALRAQATAPQLQGKCRAECRDFGRRTSDFLASVRRGGAASTEIASWGAVGGPAIGAGQAD
jgi:hypothetical protein